MGCEHDASKSLPEARLAVLYLMAQLRRSPPPPSVGPHLKMLKLVQPTSIVSLVD